MLVNELFPVTHMKIGEGETGELATLQTQWVLKKIPGQLEASILIFLTLGSIKQNNTDTHTPVSVQ